ncbi:MAG TPA: zinc metalloprotease HtpX [Devosiaceae bacterium]|nr:zinc metalloprotease HtpX [Devosiaceae bacterium]
MVNAVRTTFLLAALTGLFMAVGFVVAGQGGMLIALGLALVMNLFSYWNSDKVVLRLQHAEPIGRGRAPDLIALVEGLAAAAGIAMPRLYLIHTEQPNAFATGRNPQNAAIALSTGLLKYLERDEVAGVLAHELAHIRSRDTLTMTITATLAGAISMLAQYGLFFGSRNAASPVGPVGAILAILLAPFAAIMVQMAISRTREYEADRDAAEITGDPLALASALDKISRLAKNFENPWARRTPGMAHLYIVNPLLGDRRSDNWFSTHPDVRNRIAALRDLAGRMSATRHVPARRARLERVGEPPRGGAWRVPDFAEFADRAGQRHRPGPWG